MKRRKKNGSLSYMGILEPLALLSLPLLGAVVILYLLKFRRPTAPVASLRLWDVLLRDREANSLWQRLQVSVLLLLQVLALLVLILALARPWATATRQTARNVIIIVDVSASMGATDADNSGGKTRLQAAQEKALQIVDEMPSSSIATLITSDNHASIVVPSTDDKARLRSAISALKPNAAGTDLTEVIRVASAATAGKSSNLVWVLSDGAFPPLPQTDVGQVEYRFSSVGKVRPNQGITAMSLRQENGVTGLFVQVANSAAVTATRRLDVSVDDSPWNARTIDIGPGATQEVIIPDVPLAARVVQASLAGQDTLAVDDQAWAVNRAGAPANVLLVSSGNRFLETALALLPTVNLYKVKPETYDPSAGINGGNFDLTIFDANITATLTTTLPTGNMLFIGPSRSSVLVSVTGVITNPVPVLSGQSKTSTQSQGDTARTDEPLLKFVDLSTLHVAQAARIAPPAWGRVALGSDKGPLIIAGETGGRKVGVLAFDIKDSDLPLQTAFPLLMRNLVSYLLPDPAAGLPDSVAPLTTVGIDPASLAVDKVLVEDPDGHEHAYPITTQEPRAVFAETGVPGVYYVTQYAGADIVAQEAFAVNLFSRDESLTPPNSAAILPTGSVATVSEGATETSREEYWPLIALGGILLLLLEWLYAQRIAVRRAITEMRARRALRRAESERV